LISHDQPAGPLLAANYEVPLGTPVEAVGRARTWVLPATSSTLSTSTDAPGGSTSTVEPAEGRATSPP
jgi:hypothetical protein